MKILVKSFKDYAFCELPDGRPLYGNNADEICSCLDMMAERGMFFGCDSMEVGDYTDEFTYNRDFE